MDTTHMLAVLVNRAPWVYMGFKETSARNLGQIIPKPAAGPP